MTNIYLRINQKKLVSSDFCLRNVTVLKWFSCHILDRQMSASPVECRYKRTNRHACDPSKLQLILYVLSKPHLLYVITDTTWTLLFLLMAQSRSLSLSFSLSQSLSIFMNRLFPLDLGLSLSCSLSLALFVSLFIHDLESRSLHDHW